MRLLILGMMLAVLAGIVIHTSGPETQFIKSAFSNIDGQTIRQRDTNERRLVSADSELQRQTPQQSGANTDDVTDFTQLQGQSLRRALDRFWSQCRSENNCLVLLAEMKQALSEQEYQLIANYPDLQAQWQQQLGTLELSLLVELQDKIGLFKQHAEDIWGEYADKLLADELAVYDFALEAQALKESQSEEFVSDVDRLFVRWEEQVSSLGLEDEQAKYEKALSLIPESIDAEQQMVIELQLAQRYLTPSQQAEIEQRKHQLVEQRQQVKDYHSQLARLKETLGEQRISTYSALSESEWQSYVHQQVRVFRIEFFSTH